MRYRFRRGSHDEKALAAGVCAVSIGMPVDAGPVFFRPGRDREDACAHAFGELNRDVTNAAARAEDENRFSRLEMKRGFKARVGG